jgi:hypothetical protein
MKYLKKIKLNKKTYWQIDQEDTFDQNFIDTGVIGGFEYWNGDKPTLA